MALKPIHQAVVPALAGFAHIRVCCDDRPWKLNDQEIGELIEAHPIVAWRVDILESEANGARFHSAQPVCADTSDICVNSMRAAVEYPDGRCIAFGCTYPSRIEFARDILEGEDA